MKPSENHVLNRPMGCCMLGFAAAGATQALDGAMQPRWVELPDSHLDKEGGDATAPSRTAEKNVEEPPLEWGDGTVVSCRGRFFAFRRLCVHVRHHAATLMSSVRHIDPAIRARLELV